MNESAAYIALTAIADTTSLVYGLLFFTAFFIEKKFSSITVTLLVLFLSKGMVSLVRPDLMVLASNNGLFYKFTWYGSWMLVNIVCLLLIFKFHSINNIRASNVAIVVSMAYVALTCIQAIDFIDRASFDSGFFATVYQLSIPTINIGLIPLICYYWLRDVSRMKVIQSEG